jgi:hypothetical protein
MKIRALKLGSVCTDRATDIKGTITHWILDTGRRIDYLFQPPGTNPEDGQPIMKIVLELERLETTKDQFEVVEVPFDILGSIVTDKASGFTGTAVSFIRHINGCLHVTIQPSGVLPKTRAPIHRAEFDLRGCVGKMIPKLTPKQLEKSIEKHPSPTGDRFEKHIPAAGTVTIQ